MRVLSEKEYKGFTIVKKGKSALQIYKNGKLVAYTNTEADARKIIDRKVN